ncbi:hypothetical protein KCU99_g10125, partial [Aureobasidium melanogenum]
MASPDHTKPTLQSDSHEIKQTLLHGPTEGQQSLLPVPDHRRRPDLPLAQREIIESNLAYQTITRPSASWSWEKTEKYVHYKDTLLLEYLYDYPVVAWVIGAEDARYAVEAFLAREGMRKLGLSVYAEDTPFSWWVRGEAAPVDDNLSISNEVEAIVDEQEEEVVDEQEEEVVDEQEEEVVDEQEEEVEEVEEVESEQDASTPELLLASPDISQLVDPAASEEPQGSEDEHMSDLLQDDTTEEATAKPEPRRSTRVAQQKLKEEYDEQTKEESIGPNPRTTQTKRTVTLPKRSKKKSVQSKQQEEQRPRRRSTRVSAKRTFADEPWSAPKNQSN